MQTCRWRILIRYLLLVPLMGGHCIAQSYMTEAVWQREFPALGTFSSPRVADLNQDGVLDVVLGAGRQEFTACDTSVIALDGKDGSLLWKASARDQIFGSGVFLDINRDSFVDVIMYGRSAELFAIDGKDGNVLWRFLEGKTLPEIRDLHWYNFYNPQPISDLSGDSIPDLLVSNGGDVLAEPHDPNRPAGYLLVIDASNGSVLYKVEMPDGHEIYMSPILADLDNDQMLDIVYGTGGETTAGHLYRTTLQAVIDQDLSGSIMLADGPSKGFIGPPALADLNGDSCLDIICNAVDGRIMAFSGKTNAPLWAGKIPGCEGYASLAIADINNDSFPDIFTNLVHGVWPDLEAVRPVLIDGSNGQVIFVDSIGFYQMSSPVLADLNDDQQADGILSVNFFMPDTLGVKTIHNTLLAYDFQNRGKYALAPPLVGSNVGSTPWIGDIDDNGKLDFIYIQMTTPDRVYTYDGFRVIRLESKYRGGTVHWQGYMGDGSGIFRR